MVDEFSSFARMPTPTMRRENAQELLHQAVFLQRVAHPQITFETKAPVEPVYFECDGRLVSQALTNVLKNATEAIAACEAGGREGQGRIAITLEETGDRLIYRVADNGVGLPPQHRHRLTEPYVTDANERHGPRPRHREEDSRRPWRRRDARRSRRRRNGRRSQALVSVAAEDCS